MPLPVAISSPIDLTAWYSFVPPSARSCPSSEMSVRGQGE
jgi:hypothetical protein